MIDGERAPIGCIDPAVGVKVSRLLGWPLPPSLREHHDGCLACRLERLNFARFDAGPPEIALTTVAIAETFVGKPITFRMAGSRYTREGEALRVSGTHLVFRDSMGEGNLSIREVEPWMVASHD